MEQNKKHVLFSALSKEMKRYWQEVFFQAERDVLSFPASETDRYGQTLFANLRKGGFCTFVVTGRDIWNPNTHYFQAARFAAKRGRKIERAFLIPHKFCRPDRTLHEHMRLDQEAGIMVGAYYVGEMISNLSLPLAESLDFGIWDNAIGCVGIYQSKGTGSGINEWRVTCRAEDLQLLRSLADQIKKQALKISLDDSESYQTFDLEEPMVTTAPIARELASILCKGDHVSPEDCSWYHSIWQYLRIFDMVSTPTWHSKFYIDTLSELSKKKEYKRILISGTADYSMLAHVLWGYRNGLQPPEVTVVDLCETPLFLCKWYAKLVNKHIQTAASDILNFKDSKPFDLIVTDAFLTRFSDKDRLRVVDCWYNLLRSGGKVITTVRIEPNLSGQLVIATPVQSDAFRRRAFREAIRWQSFLNFAAEDIANLAQRYAERMTSFPIRSNKELRTIFIREKWGIEHMEIIEVPGEMTNTQYAEVIVRRE
jgi:SAM-dependent methyltransferase